MAARDLMPYISPRGGSTLTSAYPIGAGETFLQGEPVVLDANGNLTISGSNPAAVLGIAAENYEDAGSHLDTGAYGTPVAVTGRKITIYRPTDDQLFITQNFATDGLGNATTPAATDLGDQAGLILNGGFWVLDTGAGNKICEVEDVLDEQKQPISTPAGSGLLFGTALWVVFRFLAR